jgi:hypothetical protein
MKRPAILTLIIFLALFASQAFSQDKPLRFGARLGTNLTMTNADISGVDIKPRFVFNVGAFAEYWLNGTFAFQGGILYNKKGAHWGETSSFAGYTANVDLFWEFDYLSIPIHGKVAFGNRTRLFLLFGLEPGFLLSAQEKVESDSNVPGTSSSSEVEDWKDYINSFEVAFGMGLGLEFPVSQTVKMFVESRSSLSLNEVIKELPPGYSNLSDQGVRNVIGSLNLGVIF